MSECYTFGGDTWQPLVGFDISGQTFTPLESHVITFIDLNLWLFGYTPPLVYLTECDASHNPIGPILSDAHVIEPLVYLPPTQARVRFHLDTPTSLVEGHIYAIQIRQALGHVGPNNQVLYDKDDATYPRGHIIFSDDGGNTWTHFNNSDFIFCEFGGPPLPKPEPAPPIAHFATLDLTYTYHPTSITFTLATSVPCHLDCFYTEKKPVKHPTERVIRGARLLWGTYFCFVAWKFVEQTELGDTIYHTFEMPDWVYCQVKWFTFRGTVNEVTSPSIGPIFTRHHPGVLTTVNLGVSKKAYYRCVRSASPGDPDVIYNLAHSQEQADTYFTGVIQYGQRVRVVGAYAYAMIRRTAILFNTGILPPCTLLQAVLRLDMRKVSPPGGYSANWAWFLKVRAGQDLNAQITHLDLTNYSRILALGTQIGAKYADDLPAPGFQDIWEIEVPLDYINLDGFTVITSLVGNDEIGTRPTNNTIEEALFIKDTFSTLLIAYYKH